MKRLHQEIRRWHILAAPGRDTTTEMDRYWRTQEKQMAERQPVLRAECWGLPFLVGKQGMDQRSSLPSREVLTPVRCPGDGDGVAERPWTRTPLFLESLICWWFSGSPCFHLCPTCSVSFSLPLLSFTFRERVSRSRPRTLIQTTPSPIWVSGHSFTEVYSLFSHFLQFLIIIALIIKTIIIINVNHHDCTFCNNYDLSLLLKKALSQLSLCTLGIQFTEGAYRGFHKVHTNTRCFQVIPSDLSRNKCLQIFQVSFRRPGVAILTGETGLGHFNLPELLENILSHPGDQRPLVPACKVCSRNPLLARLNEHFPKTP